MLASLPDSSSSINPKGFFHELFSLKCFSYIWTIRLCQSCHMLHRAIMGIVTESDYIMPHGNQAIMAIMAIMAQSDYIMPHATHGCPYCVMLWSSQQRRWEKTPSNFVQNQVFIGETQKDEHFKILKKDNVFLMLKSFQTEPFTLTLNVTPLKLFDWILTHTQNWGNCIHS